MLQKESALARPNLSLFSKIKDYLQLLKLNLSVMVVFSSVVGYLLAPGAINDWQHALLLFIGGMLVTGAANTLNQILEIRTDALMTRTQNRPLPQQRLQPLEAWILTLVLALSGVALIAYFFNSAAAALSALSLLLYAFAYTPLKKIHPIATLVGAIPGGLPPLIGWVAATGTINTGGVVLFLIQFFWQFPHFWAIAWLGYDEYKKAGISMLPSFSGKTNFTGLQCMLYSSVLLPLAVLPRMMHLCGNIAMWVGLMLGTLMFLAAYQFYKKNDQPSARKMLFASLIYLPLILIAFLLNKY